MGGGFEAFVTAMTLLFGLASLVLLAEAFAYFRDRKGYAESLDRLRQNIDEAAPTDPQYNRARQLYAVGAVEVATHRNAVSVPTDVSSDGGDSGGDGGGD